MYIKTECYNLYLKGKSVKFLSNFFSKSQNTIYRYINEIYSKLKFPELRTELKTVLLSGDLKAFLNKTSFKNLSLLCREFNLKTERTKISKINTLFNYLKETSLLGLYPNILKKDSMVNTNKYDDDFVMLLINQTVPYTKQIVSYR